MPLKDLLEEQFKVRTRAVEDPRNVTVITTTAKMILGNNPNRLGFTIVNTGTKKCAIALTNAVTLLKGLPLDAGGGHITMKWMEDFEMVGWAWWIISDVGGSTAYSLTVVEY